MTATGDPTRLVSRWYAAACLGLVGVCAAIALALALGTSGVIGAAWAGRLHRWPVELDDHGLTYQGYRRATSEP